MMPDYVLIKEFIYLKMPGLFFFGSYYKAAKVFSPVVYRYGIHA
jgi:hypothetical protein